MIFYKWQMNCLSAAASKIPVMAWIAPRQSGKTALALYLAQDSALLTPIHCASRTVMNRARGQRVEISCSADHICRYSWQRAIVDEAALILPSDLVSMYNCNYRQLILLTTPDNAIGDDFSHFLETYQIPTYIAGGLQNIVSLDRMAQLARTLDESRWIEETQGRYSPEIEDKLNLQNEPPCVLTKRSFL